MHSESASSFDSPQFSASFRDVRVDFSSMELFRNDRTFRLTALECKVLGFLLRNSDRVVYKTEFVEAIWQNKIGTRAVDNVIFRLRQKLESNPSRPFHLRTVHSVGYKVVL